MSWDSCTKLWDHCQKLKDKIAELKAEIAKLRSALEWSNGALKDAYGLMKYKGIENIPVIKAGSDALASHGREGKARVTVQDVVNAHLMFQDPSYNALLAVVEAARTAYVRGDLESERKFLEALEAYDSIKDGGRNEPGK